MTREEEIDQDAEYRTAEVIAKLEAGNVYVGEFGHDIIKEAIKDALPWGPQG